MRTLGNMIVDCGSLAPQRGEIPPKKDSRIEPLNRIDSSSHTNRRRMIHPLLGERTEVRAGVQTFFGVLGELGGRSEMTSVVENKSLRSKENPLFHPELLTAHEPDRTRVSRRLIRPIPKGLCPPPFPNTIDDIKPERVFMPRDDEIIETFQRGSLAPQRREGLRVRGEITQIVGNKHPASSGFFLRASA